MHPQTLSTITAKVFALLIFAMVANSAHAQQGDECLACHTGLPATEHNLIGEETVELTDACDYTDADFFDGWGWNPVLGESCPPLEQVSDNDPHDGFPVCSAVFYDSDGDGFGWENEASCIVTSDSATAPVFINQQTGTQVDLARAYWDGNTDLVNKTIQCDLHYFDSYTGSYRKEGSDYTHSSDSHPMSNDYQFRHQPLPSTRPFNGWVTAAVPQSNGEVRSAAFSSQPLWTVDDGRYLGATVLQSPYVELVSNYNGTKGVRIWHNRNDELPLRLFTYGQHVERDGYFECWDIAGSDLEPTGSPGTPTSSPATVSDLVFSIAPDPENDAPEDIVSVVTQQPVELNKAYWDYNNDVAGKPIACTRFFGQSATYNQPASYQQGGPNWDLRFPKHFTNTGNRIDYWEAMSGADVRMSATAVLEDGVLNEDFQLIFNSDHVEQLSDRVRFWMTSTHYMECTNLRPTGVAPTAHSNGGCDYTNADQYGGWGWNPETRESCPPVDSVNGTTMVVDNCDYSDADTQGGWGWDAVALQSCPPIDSGSQTTAQSDDACDYSNAATQDGWGWNPETSTSCAPVDSIIQTTDVDDCDYTDAENHGGWGWNPETRTSCEPRGS